MPRPCRPMNLPSTTFACGTTNPCFSTYRQLQEIRLYYRFLDVDIDRYILDGDYRQVMLSARELDVDQLPRRSPNLD